MNTLFKTLSAAVLLGLSAGAGATIHTVDGITWDDTDPDNFSMQFNFTQWYTSAANAISSAANATPNFGAAQTVPGGLTFNDSTLTGVGEVYSINGTGANIFFPGGGELTMVIGGIVATSATTFDFTNGFINFYSDAGPADDFPWPSDAASQADADAAANGNLWLTTSVSKLLFTQVGGAGLNDGFVAAVLDITGGSAQGDITHGIGPKIALQFDYAGSAFFETGTAISQQGNGQIHTVPVPEPGSMALLGLGLLGFYSVRLSRKV